MIKTYHKLIRDKIPQIIKSQGQCCIVRKLSDEEYLEMVDAKLDEELAEYHKDQNLEELADLVEVIYAAAEARGFTVEQLEQTRLQKKARRGAFRKKLLLMEIRDF
jgi:predicted house-cleaning noncanonical NTP pyrophosphatase (MazG superfamily)